MKNSIDIDDDFCEKLSELLYIQLDRQLYWQLCDKLSRQFNALDRHLYDKLSRQLYKQMRKKINEKLNGIYV
jgi:hypothetical protein